MAGAADGSRPVFWLIAGPNGVGKTTFAFRHLRAVAGTLHFVNMDEIARGLEPLQPEAAQGFAARTALLRARDLIAARTSFAMETTLSGHAHLRLMELARAGGLETGLLYFTVPRVEICLERIERRVAEGGHSVPEDLVRRRFTRSIALFPTYAAAADRWRAYDNSGPRPAVVMEGRGRRIDWAGEDAASLPGRLGAGLDRPPAA